MKDIKFYHIDQQVGQHYGTDHDSPCHTLVNLSHNNYAAQNILNDMVMMQEQGGHLLIYKALSDLKSLHSKNPLFDRIIDLRLLTELDYVIIQ